MTYFYLILSGFLVLLGFIALLTQRIYFDPKTNKPIEIKVPIVGKLKSNYPALVFVFLGVFLAVYTFPPKEKEWVITGCLKTRNPIPNPDWRKGVIWLFPSKVRGEITDKGRFTIHALIEDGKMFEDVIERIDITTDFGSRQIYPKQDLEQFKKQPQDSNLQNVTSSTREYKDIFINTY